MKGKQLATTFQYLGTAPSQHRDGFLIIITLILKTIGNRKGDCAWSCSRWQTQPEKICKSQRTNQCHSLRTLYWFVRCDLQIFSGCVCHLEQLHAQSPFLFPIVFSINLIPFFDICSVDYLLFFHPGCSGMCCFTWAAARSQQYTLLFVVLAAGILWFAAGCHVRDASAGWSWMDHARPSSNVMHGACEDARRACANTLLYFSCLKHVNEIVLGKSRQAHQRKQSFRFPSSLINHSTLLLERQARQASCLYNHALEHSTGSERVDVPSFLSLLNALQSCTGTLDRLWTRRRAKLLVLLNASKRQASCLYNHALEHSTGCTRRRVRSTRNGTG